MRGWRTERSRRARDAARFATPIAPPRWPPVGDPFEPVDAVADVPVAGAVDPVGVTGGVDPVDPVGSVAPVASVASGPAPTSSAPALPAPEIRHQPITDTAPEPAPLVPVQLEMQSEFLRLLEVVTSMCDHVIEYIENDRAERRVMVETLTDLGRVITDGAAAVVAAVSAIPTRTPPAIEVADPGASGGPTGRERVIGGSMSAGPEPEPVIDLRAAEAAWDAGVPSPPPNLAPAGSGEAAEPMSDGSLRPTRSTPHDIAVEVRGRFGDRWVDGFEICEVMTTPAGPRYRLRRRRDGVVLPELFEASSIRHVETLDQSPAAAEATEREETVRATVVTEPGPGSGSESAPLNPAPAYWSRS